jgi:cation-transporting ATPase 13A1
MVAVPVSSSEITAATLHRRIPLYLHLYASPFIAAWSTFAYAYFIKYDEWFGAQEWAFLAGAIVLALHLLSFLVTQWSTGAKARLTCLNVSSLSVVDHLPSTEATRRPRPSTKPIAFASYLPNIAAGA